MPPAYVFFDVDNTLVEWKMSWAGAFAEAAGEAGVSVTADEAWEVLRGAFDHIYQECIQRHSGTGDVRGFWMDYDGQLLAALGVNDDLKRHTEKVIDLLSRPDSITLYPEVPEVLQELGAAGVKLGIVTGRPVAGPDLERLGVLHHFDLVIDAFAAGSPKSEGRMFFMAAKAAAAEGLAAWHVGDSYKDDVGGARAAGMRPVLVDRWELYPEADCLRITDLLALPGLVADGAAEPQSDPIPSRRPNE